jgi:hypothetical protein
MPDMQHLDGVAFYGEQDAVDMWLSTVEELTQFNGRIWILRSERATGGNTRQRRDCCSECYEPALPSRSSMLRSEPLVYGGNVPFGLIG